MNRCGNIVVGTAITAVLGGLAPALAQTTTFLSYRCGDGSEFIVGFYPYDSSAYLQIEGGAVTLPRRPTLSGMRYARGGVTLKVSKAGRITVKRPGRRKTACELL